MTREGVKDWKRISRFIDSPEEVQGFSSRFQFKVHLYPWLSHVQPWQSWESQCLHYLQHSEQGLQGIPESSVQGQALAYWGSRGRPLGLLKKGGSFHHVRILASLTKSSSLYAGPIQGGCQVDFPGRSRLSFHGLLKMPYPLSSISELHHSSREWCPLEDQHAVLGCPPDCGHALGEHGASRKKFQQSSAPAD